MQPEGPCPTLPKCRSCACRRVCGCAQIATTRYYVHDRSKRMVLWVQLASIGLGLVVGIATVFAFFRKIVTHHRGTAKEPEVRQAPCDMISLVQLSQVDYYSQ